MQTVRRFKIILFILPALLPLLVALFSATFLVITVKQKNNVRYESGMEVNENVQGYAALIAQKAGEHEIGDYARYLMAIMMVESGGTGNDPMQSLAGVPEEEKTADLSIEYAVVIFAGLLERGRNAGVDIDTIIQAYNFGAGYIDFVAANGKEHSYSLASDFAARSSRGAKVTYNNAIAVRTNGGWRYAYGNMFYVYLVHQYLAGDPLDAGITDVIIQEALKYRGWSYVWGGSSPTTSFDCSGLTSWCYGVAGLSLPRTAQQQYDAMQHITLDEAVPGDLVFFTNTTNSGNYITHVGIYLGDNKMFHAGDPIGYADLTGRYWRQHFVCCGRYN